MSKLEAPKLVLEPQVLQEIMTSLKDLRYGSVEITIQGGKVIQIERKEKRRLKNS